MFIPKDRVPLKGSERAAARNANYVGAADPSESLDVTVRLRSKGQPKAAVRAGAHFSREEFENSFGASSRILALWRILPKITN